PRSVLPSKYSTLPVGVALPAVSVTVAVKVTAPPTADGLAEEATVAEVALLTVWVRGRVRAWKRRRWGGAAVRGWCPTANVERPKREMWGGGRGRWVWGRCRSARCLGPGRCCRRRTRRCPSARRCRQCQIPWP